MSTPARVRRLAAQGVSVVLPVHNEADNLRPLHAELTRVLADLGGRYEIIAVDDGSTDGTPVVLAAMARCDPHLRVITLDGNFGEAAALTAGFHAARYPVVVTLDADGQNDPADIPRLLEALAPPGVVAVSGVRTERMEPALVRVWPSRVANWLIARATGLPAHDCGCGLKAYRADALRGIALPPGAHRFLPALLGVGRGQFREVAVRDRARRSGRSHYGLRRIFAVLRDLPAVAWMARRGAGARRQAAAVAALACAAFLAAARQAPRLAVVPAVVAAASAMACHGLARFERARRLGVYRRRETT